MDSVTQTTNYSSFTSSNLSGNNTEDDDGNQAFENVVKIVVPLFFGMIVILGIVGNLLVIVVVLFNQQMRNTTNILILNLAIADLLFIIVCVPFTATVYALPFWPFGVIWCKIYQYVLNICAYASVYTLVVMSFDRYLAVVHPISSMTIRTERNTWMATMIVWLIITVGHIPTILPYIVIEYRFEGEMRSTCVNGDFLGDGGKIALRIFYGCFFAFGFVIPVGLIIVLYAVMIRRLTRAGPHRGGSHSGEGNRSKRRVTRMIIIVVVIFALCWMPVQVIFLIQSFFTAPDTKVFIGLKIAATCIAYMNSCVNPILYAFLSENFRKGFRKVLSLGQHRPSQRYNDFERSTHRAGAQEPLTQTKEKTENHVNNGAMTT